MEKYSTYYFRRISFLVFITILFSVGNCFAQEEQEPTDDFVLEELVVTATKRGETKLQETPISISVMNDEFLRNKNAYGLDTLTLFTPNAQFTHGMYSTVFIRGVGNSHGSRSLSESAVGIYLDGVYLERGLTAGNSFYDVERIEVLRGPQGTLYGRNSTGGAVNIITKDPTDWLKIHLGGEIASFNKRRVDASISGPIVNGKLNARITVSDSEADGFMENKADGGELGDENFTGMRGAIDFMPTDLIDIKLRADYYDSETGGQARKNIARPDTFAGTGLRAFGYVPPDGYHEAAIDTDEKQEVEDRGVSGHINIKLTDNSMLRSITSVRNRESTAFLDADGTDIPWGTQTFYNDINQFSQELLLDGSFGKFKPLVGVFYYNMDEKFDENADMDFAFGTPPGFGISYNSEATMETQAYAVFGNIGYQITDRLGLDVGVRYSHEEKESTGFLDWSVPFIPNLPEQTLKNDWSSVTPKFSMDFAVNDEAMLYGTVSKGFRSGIFWPGNVIGNPAPTAEDQMVDPEYVWNYEIGAKTEWFNKRLRTNVSAFYMDYTDMQVITPVFGINQLQNAAESTIQGAELEITTRLFDTLNLNCVVSYLDATFDEFTSSDDAGSEVDASGNKLPNAPEWKLALGAQYGSSLGKWGFLTYRVDLSWSDDVYTTPLEDENNMIESHTLISAVLKWDSSKGRWSAEGYCTNLADAEYQAVSSYAGGTVSPFSERKIGLRVAFRY